MGSVTRVAGLPLLSDYAAFARRHAKWLAVFVGVGLAAGLIWSARQPATYSATVSIAMTPVPKYVTVPSELLPPEVTVDTDAQLLRSPAVVDAIATELGVDPSTVEKRVAVTASANSHVLHVTVESGSPERSAAAANAAAGALIEVRGEALGALHDSQLNLIRVMLDSTEAQISRTMNRRLVNPETDELYLELFALRRALDELEAAQATPAEVIRVAEPPKRPDYANTEVPLASGLMLGLLVGCLVGAVRDRGLLRAPTHSHSLSLHHVRPTAG